MDLRTFTPRTLALLDRAAGGRLLTFVQQAYGHELEVDLQVARSGVGYDLIVHALDADRVLSEARWEVGKVHELPEPVGAAVLCAYLDGVLAQCARFRAGVDLRMAELARQGRLPR